MPFFVWEREALEDVEVLLMNESMEPYIYTRSDENGNFTFDDLAFGRYMIYAELMGINTTPALINLHEGQPEVWVEIRVFGNEANYFLSVRESKERLTGISQVYPNPASENAMLEMTVSAPLQLELVIYGQLGQVIWNHVLDLGAGAHRISIPAGELPAGYYYLRATSSQGDQITRRIVISH